MIVYHSDGLHERIGNHRADIGHASFFHVPAHGLRDCRFCRNMVCIGPVTVDHFPISKAPQICIKGTNGWEIRPEIMELLDPDNIIDKPYFGSIELAETLKKMAEKEDLQIEIIGLCTDICVVSNALMLKAWMPEVHISTDRSCCAGVTPEQHNAALSTMASCQIEIK